MNLFHFSHNYRYSCFPIMIVGAKHRETKQFYTLYNTLDDTKQYLTKELSLLNSIYENYAEYVQF